LSTCVCPSLQAWFHLYRILLTADDLAPAEVAPTLEQFMQVRTQILKGFVPAQCSPSSHKVLYRFHPAGKLSFLAALQTSPSGEYSSRLALLEAFARQLDAMSAPQAARASQAAGTDGAGQQEAARFARWRQLSALLHNSCRYYRQFEGAVQAQAAAGMAELEKSLQVGARPAGFACFKYGSIMRSDGSCSAVLPFGIFCFAQPMPSHPTQTPSSVFCFGLPPAGLCGPGQVGGPRLLRAQVTQQVPHWLYAGLRASHPERVCRLLYICLC
jgi:hypothetical protein